MHFVWQSSWPRLTLLLSLVFQSPWFAGTVICYIPDHWRNLKPPSLFLPLLNPRSPQQCSLQCSPQAAISVHVHIMYNALIHLVLLLKDKQNTIHEAEVCLLSFFLWPSFPWSTGPSMAPVKNRYAINKELCILLTKLFAYHKHCSV